MAERQSGKGSVGTGISVLRGKAKDATAKPFVERRKADPGLVPKVERRRDKLAELAAAQERRLGQIAKAAPLERRKADPSFVPKVERRRANVAANAERELKRLLEAAAPAIVAPAPEVLTQLPTAPPRVKASRASSRARIEKTKKTAAGELPLPVLALKPKAAKKKTPRRASRITKAAKAVLAPPADTSVLGLNGSSVAVDPELRQTSPDEGTEAGEALSSDAGVPSTEHAEYQGVERRVLNARRGPDVEEAIRVRQHQTRLMEAATWMRKGGAVLVGLNAVMVIAVFMLGRVHVSQLKEMHRATAASGAAAYAACLGTQTARSMLMEIKAERMGVRNAPSAAAPGTLLQGSADTARIAFELEKTASLTPHVPVLFHFAVTNTGSSAALHAKVWSAVKVLDSGAEPDFRYDDVALSRGVIAPGDASARVITYTQDGGKVVPLTDAQAQRVSSGAAYVVAYGRVEYQDAAGIRHRAEFCEPLTQPTGVASHSNRCRAYNHASEGENPARPAELLRVAQSPVRAQPTGDSQTAAMTLPEIACEVPRDEKD